MRRRLPLLGALVVLAAAPRLAGLDQSLLGDELFTYEISTRDGLRDVLAGVRSGLEITPPLYFVLAWVSAEIGGDPTHWLRVPSLIAGVLSVPVLYALGERVAGRTAGLLAAVLLALSPFALFYSVEARAYGVMTLLAMVSTLALLRWLDAPGRGTLVVFVLAACGALYAHYTALFVLVPQAAWVLFAHRDRLRPLLVAHGGVIALYLPWAPFLVEDTRSEAQGISGALAPLTPETLGTALVTWLDGIPFTRLAELPGALGLALLAGAGVLIAVGLAELRRRPSAKSPDSALLLVGAVAVAGPLGATLVGLGGTSFLPRNFYGSLPYLLLLAAAAVVSLRRPLAVAAAGSLLAAFALGLAGALSDDHRRPPYEDVARYVDEAARPGDPVLELTPLDPEAPSARALEVNLERPHSLYRAGPGEVADAALRAGRGRTLLVVASEGSAHPGSAGLPDFGAPVARRSYRGLRDITIYLYRPPAVPQ